jgi:Cu2+-exporting ATPase
MTIPMKSISIQDALKKSALSLESSDWKALDTIDEWSHFSQSTNKNDTRWESHIVIEGMHCAACAFKVENALKSLSGVIETSVNATSGHAKIIWQSNLIQPAIYCIRMSVKKYNDRLYGDF